MEVTRGKLDDALLLEVSGSVDIYTSPELRGELKAALERKAPRIVVDLERVSFIDSSGLATLIEALQKVKSYSGALVLCNLTTQVKNVFQLANLDRIFDIRDSRDDVRKGGAKGQ